MQLLVSVAGAPDAMAAVDGGADIVDAKNPAAGALGAVTIDVFLAIATTVNGVKPLSAALGEPEDDRDAAHLTTAFAAAGARFVKLGFRAGATLATMTRVLAAARDASDAGVIAAAYADVGGALARQQVVDAAVAAGVAGVLLDTAHKTGPGLSSLCSPQALLEWTTHVSAAGLLVALAGRLSLEDIERVGACGAAIVGVRGAACDDGRTGRVSRARVQKLKAACVAAGSALRIHHV